MPCAPQVSSSILVIGRSESAGNRIRPDSSEGGYHHPRLEIQPIPPTNAGRNPKSLPSGNPDLCRGQQRRKHAVHHLSGESHVRVRGHLHVCHKRKRKGYHELDQTVSEPEKSVQSLHLRRRSRFSSRCEATVGNLHGNVYWGRNGRPDLGLCAPE